ncbi:hypothetical protein [Paenibacillus zanthoxyli]|uniref:hypothetical protein n=1 Tax=Paenibacillus zanthoxyli TaxID=369399 RepID=UPI0004B390F3|nr:hypothetical protein [Paenibacillus zanthoxyli]
MKTLNEIKKTLMDNHLPCPMFIMEELEERDKKIKELHSALGLESPAEGDQGD